MLISLMCVRTKPFALSHWKTVNNYMSVFINNFTVLSFSERGRLYIFFESLMHYLLDGLILGEFSKDMCHFSFLSIDLFSRGKNGFPIDSEPLTHSLFICYTY